MSTFFPFDWVMQDMSWQDEAACLGLHASTGRDYFFPPDNPGGPKRGKGITGETDRVRTAKAICAGCPVLRECLGYALKNDLTGIWGGMTDRERKIARRKAAS